MIVRDILGNNPAHANVPTKVVIKNLSAAGSNIDPSTVCWFHFLAK